MAAFERRSRAIGRQGGLLEFQVPPCDNEEFVTIRFDRTKGRSFRIDVGADLDCDLFVFSATKENRGATILYIPSLQLGPDNTRIVKSFENTIALVGMENAPRLSPSLHDQVTEIWRDCSLRVVE